MLDYSILKCKPNIRRESTADGSSTVVYKDLLSKTTTDNRLSFYNSNIVVVTKDYIARPDLVSLAIYGSDEYADIICKFNNISNPFELNEGMVLILPDLSSVRNVLTVGKPSEEAKADNTINKIEKNNQKKRNESRSPGQQVIGEKSYVIDRENRIIYY